MELLDRILRRAKRVKETLDLEEKPLALASQLVQLKQEVAKLESWLNESDRLSDQKDALIARLESVATMAGNTIVDGPAFFVRENGTLLDGPFCTRCFGRSQEKVRMIPVAKPKSGAGNPSEWVQCLKCRKPLRSKRIGEYLSPSPSTQNAASFEKEEKMVRQRPPKCKARRLTRLRKAKSR
jgi:hypothetical protein